MEVERKCIELKSTKTLNYKKSFKLIWGEKNQIPLNKQEDAGGRGFLPHSCNPPMMVCLKGIQLWGQTAELYDVSVPSTNCGNLLS